MGDGDAFGSRYILGPLIGRGGMGRVYRATTRATGTEVAIKFLRDDLADDPETLARFVQERRVLRAVAHPNVVRVHDLIVEGDQLGIVMDYVPGGDLRKSALFKQNPSASIALLAQVADGLAAVHAAGVVHRDLKPENVLVDATDGPATLRLTDFGVSKILGNTMTVVTSVIGTPGYIAPEVAEGQSPTSAADLYALGVMLYQACTGRQPFESDSVNGLIRMHAEQTINRPIGMDDELWSLLSRLMSHDPAERPLAREVGAALRAAAPGTSGQEFMAVPEPRSFSRPTTLLPHDDTAETTPPRRANVAPAVVAPEAAAQSRTPPPNIEPVEALPAPATADPSRRRGLAFTALALAVLVATAGVAFAASRRDAPRSVPIKAAAGSGTDTSSTITPSTDPGATTLTTNAGDAGANLDPTSVTRKPGTITQPGGGGGGDDNNDNDGGGGGGGGDVVVPPTQPPTTITPIRAAFALPATTERYYTGLHFPGGGGHYAQVTADGSASYGQDSAAGCPEAGQMWTQADGTRTVNGRSGQLCSPRSGGGAYNTNVPYGYLIGCFDRPDHRCVGRGVWFPVGKNGRIDASKGGELVLLYNDRPTSSDYPNAYSDNEGHYSITVNFPA